MERLLRITGFKLTSDKKEEKVECTCSARHGELPIESVNVYYCHASGEYHEIGCKKIEKHLKEVKHLSHGKKTRCCCGA